MHLDNFELVNLGPINRIDVKLDRHFNVIAGVNGAGKSTILRALSIMLGRYSSAVRTGRATGSFDRENIRRGSKFASASATIISEFGQAAEKVTWHVGVSRPGRKVKPLTLSRNLIEFAGLISEKIENFPESASLPFAVFYSVNRAVLDVPLRIRTKVGFDQYVALNDALTQGGRSFRTFFSWFRDREDVENEMRADGVRKRDRQLTAVRRAVSGMLPNFENLRVRRQPLRMLITKEGIDLRIDELSDGEKCLLAMVGDLARRLAVANPGMANPLEGTAIVLIDELELHLHPAWQRSAVINLKATFPNCQFIVTSHSAQILGEVEPESLILLIDGQMLRPLQSYGRDANLILQELMGASERPTSVKADLEQLYDFIEEQKLTRARKALRALEAQLGTSDPDLMAARSVLGAA